MPLHLSKLMSVDSVYELLRGDVHDLTVERLRRMVDYAGGYSSD